LKNRIATATRVATKIAPKIPAIVLPDMDRGVGDCGLAELELDGTLSVVLVVVAVFVSAALLELALRAEGESKAQDERKVEVDRNVEVDGKVEVDDKVEVDNKLEVDSRFEVDNKLEIDNRLEVAVVDGGCDIVLVPLTEIPGLITKDQCVQFSAVYIAGTTTLSLFVTPNIVALPRPMFDNL
jgi:hypothetical protein